MPLQPVPSQRLQGARVLYTDLDGTMLGPDGSFLHAPDGTATSEPASALAALHSAGVEVVPVSGRALQGLVRDARLLGIGTVIAEMGGFIAYEHGREIVENFGAVPESGVTPRAWMERHAVIESLYAAFAGSVEPHAPWTFFPRDVTALMRGRVVTTDVDAWLAEQGWGWLTLYDNGRLHGAYLGLDAGQTHAYHLQPRGTTKGSAVALDRVRRRLVRSESVAIGDAIADLELAAEVGTLVIVRDALRGDPDLTAAVTSMDDVFITERDQNLGWADVARAIAGA